VLKYFTHGSVAETWADDLTAVGHDVDRSAECLDVSSEGIDLGVLDLLDVSLGDAQHVDMQFWTIWMGLGMVRRAGRLAAERNDDEPQDDL
jgi:hypothetical protein